METGGWRGEVREGGIPLIPFEPSQLGRNRGGRNNGHFDSKGQESPAGKSCRKEGAIRALSPEPSLPRIVTSQPLLRWCRS